MHLYGWLVPHLPGLPVSYLALPAVSAYIPSHGYVWRCWVAREQMVVNNLWELAPPEPPTADELREETQRQAAKKARRPARSRAVCACSGRQSFRWAAPGRGWSVPACLRGPCLHDGLQAARPPRPLTPARGRRPPRRTTSARPRRPGPRPPTMTLTLTPAR